MAGELLQGIEQAVRWDTMLLLAVGTIVGDLAAAIPGLSAIQAIALLLPFTAYLSPVGALALLVGIYKGGCFGGSTTAILLATPGTAEASATVLDGYPMARQGMAGKALRIALWSSVTADLFAALVLIFGAAVLAPYALKIGPPEYFALVVCALTIIGLVGQASPARSAVAVGLGFLLATVGQDPVHGAVRFDIGVLALTSGIPLVPMIIGLLAIPELLDQFGKRHRSVSVEQMRAFLRDPEKQRFTLAEYRRCLPTMLRSSAVGAVIGALPGLGGAIAAFVSYGVARRLSKHPERFGKGEMEGLAAAEAGDSATVGPTLIPLLTLGIPGSGTAALFIPAFLLHGVQVGPRVFADHGPVVYGLFALFVIGTAVHAVVGIGIRAAAARILAVPPNLLYPAVLLMTLVGAYTAETSLVAVGVALFFGGLGMVMRRFGFPPIPLLIAFVLGGLTETALGQSLLLFDNRLSGFLERPLALAFFALAAGIALVAARGAWQGARSRERRPAADQRA
ncbi:MAG TPA: tripartite tricarboxylate transporter permease [Thermodesulfobacteriota bacterium]